MSKHRLLTGQDFYEVYVSNIEKVIQINFLCWEYQKYLKLIYNFENHHFRAILESQEGFKVNQRNKHCRKMFKKFYQELTCKCYSF